MLLTIPKDVPAGRRLAHLFIYVSKASILVGRVSEFRVSLTSPDLAHPPQQEVSPQDAQEPPKRLGECNTSRNPSRNH